jgi:K+-transporting ATPase ATPase B chain
MFVVEIGSAFTTLLFFAALAGIADAAAGFTAAVSAWLWFTVLFANFAEAMAEGRGKAQADTLRKARRDVIAKRLEEPARGAAFEEVASARLRAGEVVLVEAGDFIPCDGEIVEGVASVDESAITGESAPVIREAGGDFSAVTGGTRVLSDWLVVRVTANPGETFLDRMIAMVEGAKRKKTPNEIALDILLAALTIIFLLVTVTILPFSDYAVDATESTTDAPASMLQAMLGIGVAGLTSIGLGSVALALIKVAVERGDGSRSGCSP